MFRTRTPLSLVASYQIPLGLHVLGLPLAFILSQDQTLHCMSFLLSLTRQNWLRSGFFSLLGRCYFYNILSMIFYLTLSKLIRFICECKSINNFYSDKIFFKVFFYFFNLLKTSPKNIPNRQTQITHLLLHNQQILIASAKVKLLILTTKCFCNFIAHKISNIWYSVEKNINTQNNTWKNALTIIKTQYILNIITNFFNIKTHYPNILLLKPIIFKAVIPASIPLFPKPPPLLAIDCSLLSSVNTQNTAGVFVNTLQSLIPWATPEQT